MKELNKLTETRTTVLERGFKYVSLFAGIGGFDTALNELGGECVMASEIDKFAKQAYEVMYGVEPKGDITKIKSEDIPEHDLLTAGFPCQAFSTAGKRAGMAYKCTECGHEQTITFNEYADRSFVCEECEGVIEPVDGRGLLFFEVARVARDKQPKILLLENVKGLVGHDKGRTLDTMVKTLNDIGYTIDFEVLNTKYFGLPQNRERIFIVAFRDDLVEATGWSEESRKGSTVVPKGKRRLHGYGNVKAFDFPFPGNDTVTSRLIDVLETEVGEKYYLNDEKTAGLIEELEEHYDGVNTGNDGETASLCEGVNLSAPIDANYAKGMGPSDIAKNRARRSHVLEGNVRVAVRENTKKGYAVAEVGDSINVAHPNSKTRRGRVGKQIANTLVASGVEQAVIDVKGITYNRKDGIKEDRDIAHSLSASDWRGLNRNQNQTAILEALPMGCEIPQDPNMLGLLDMKGNESIRHVYDPNACGPTLTTMGGGHREPKTVESDGKKHRIRKFTPLECWRLQGFTDEQHNAVEQAGISNSQRYKQAGNAVSVPVIKAIVERMLRYIKE